MATPAFEDIAETFEFLPDWEDRYREVIALGKAMEPMPEALKVPATKVTGCASQVWIHPEIAGGTYAFQGDSDASIVRGLIAILKALYTGVPLEEVGKVNAPAEFARLGLDSHLSAQRSNGLKSMIKRIQETAREAA
ncbi:Sulfur acceptor protein SufE for iron-sulfur cluster assembly [Rubellimicrobium mesophilum DSM 19309]|uniref:Sulfur acceptor protein SufE for iron-sulfur cluster assembly n=1 Tax=Rubellimicrobium mesophilum DSM 19309 TaxID=442562 RepID=A0A017HQV9_9RHOB|nr:SufE family protein [Rubellimicrobium mesophilum]EYD76771.1 Sulfur acceptor protein SufE for iron-sulfur cluster assembly [Rubellimicrobium mesophilum DSM 19309]